MTTTTSITVTGMTCDHCVASVRAELEKVAGVEGVEIDLASGGVTVTSREPVRDDDLRAAVDEAGYEVAP